MSARKKKQKEKNIVESGNRSSSISNDKAKIWYQLFRDENELEAPVLLEVPRLSNGNISVDDIMIEFSYWRGSGFGDLFSWCYKRELPSGDDWVELPEKHILPQKEYMLKASLKANSVESQDFSCQDWTLSFLRKVHSKILKVYEVPIEMEGSQIPAEIQELEICNEFDSIGPSEKQLSDKLLHNQNKPVEEDELKDVKEKMKIPKPLRPQLMIVRSSTVDTWNEGKKNIDMEKPVRRVVRYIPLKVYSVGVWVSKRLKNKSGMFSSKRLV